jgi:hypothetical protein
MQAGITGLFFSYSNVLKNYELEKYPTKCNKNITLVMFFTVNIP